MWNPTPWMVDGARHSGALGRLVAFASLGGSEGVVLPTDLKVTALGSPGAAVQVAAGGAIILNRYPGGVRESYVGLNPASHQVSIAATTSAGGRTDLIVARVEDPEFDTGITVPDPLNYQYVYTEVIQGVSSTVTTASELNLNYPAVALARVTLPASTSAVTSGMVTDLRRVARPRKDRALLTVYPTGTYAGGTSHPIPTSSYSSWPIRAGERPSVFVPEWATDVNIVVHMSGVYYVHAGTARTVAGIRTGFGTSASENGIIIDNATGRRHYTVVGSHTVDPSYRGTIQMMNVQGVRTEGTGMWYADYQTSVSIDYEFTEKAS